MCGNDSTHKNEKLVHLLNISQMAMVQSKYWKIIEKVAEQMLKVTNHTHINNQNYYIYLDNIFDCVVCHHCLGLPDIPKEFAVGHIISDADYLETKSRLFSIEYFENSANYNQLISLNYGHYFVVLLNRMMGIVEGKKGFRKLYIQVTSDSIITPQLKILGIADSSRRPPWGSTLIYELYQTKQKYEKSINLEDYAVRILFNGKTTKVCGNNNYCTLKEFNDRLKSLLPTPQDCKFFYDNYHYN